ncbi:hypothetical protein ACHAXT_003594 [Thalassiosira profunda]
MPSPTDAGDHPGAPAAAAAAGGAHDNCNHGHHEKPHSHGAPPAPDPTDPSNASRKRPPETMEEGGPTQRPRTEGASGTTQGSSGAASGFGGTVASPSRVQEAADGIINLATTRLHENASHARFDHSANPFASGAEFASVPGAVAGLNGAQDVSQTSNSVLQLSVTKSKPSFTEPWRKFPPEISVGTGAVIAWNDSPANKAAASPGVANEGKLNEGKSPGQSGEAAADGGGKQPPNEPTGIVGNGTGGKRGIRILTTARTVQHATSIRARAPSSPLSVGCTVEWMSLSMDLALLKVAGELNTAPLPVNASLPCLGGEVACVGFPSAEGLQALGHGEEADVHKGLVAGFYADNGEHHLLRMKVTLSSHGSESAGGGIVLGSNGHIVGLSTSAGVIIPGPVIDQFLRLCCGCKTPPEQPCKRTSGHTDCEGSASHDTGDETSGSKAKPPRSAKQPKPHAGGIAHLPGIPTLGITGVQTLENRALRRSLGLTGADSIDDGRGVRILGINHTVHPNNDSEFHAGHCKEDKKCHSSSLRTDDVLLALDGEPIRLDGTARLAPGRDHERVDFRWLVARRPAGSEVKLDVVRQGKRMEIHATLKASTYLVPRCDEGGVGPSYVICGGCVFVPLTRAWISETLEKQNGKGAGDSLPEELQGVRRYLQEQRRGDQQLIVLSHVLPDEVNVGYHGMRDMILTAVNGQRPVTNMQHLVELLVKKERQSLDFRCACLHQDRAKVVISMDAKEVMDSEMRILGNYMIDSWCTNALSPSLRKEAEGKAHKHGVTCGVRTMRALRNSVRQTTLVPVRRPVAVKGNDAGAVAATRRIMDLSEAHKMQSAPLFAGKWTEEGGWTQVKTKHLSQLCTCGKSTRFYCICSVGVMRCKDCFIQHCRDHTSAHECSESCAPNCEGVEVLAEGVELVTTKKRKRNNPTQAIQSRCVVCKAKTCYCCSVCGFEKEIALCHVSTGRNCLAIHASELHNPKSPAAV